MRTVRPCILLCVLLGTAFVNAAIAQSRKGPPPITWCEHPSRSPEWTRDTVTLILVMPGGRDAVSPVPLGKVLEGIVLGYLEINPWLRPGDTLMHGDSRYTPRVLFTSVNFILRADGTVDSVQRSPKGDTTFQRDLEASLRMAAAARVLPTWTDSTEHLRLNLSVQDGLRPFDARWAAFTIYAPVTRFPRPRGGNPKPRYAKQGWTADLLMQFMVDEDGAPDPSSIRNLRPAEKIRWESDEQRAVYAAFERAVRDVIPRMRFHPQEIAGCRVKMVVQQPFSFSTR